MRWERMCEHKTLCWMGFRRSGDFNLALLGKQGWRLVVRDDSLVTKIFKARYYPNGSFLSSKLGSNPSFNWRSIIETQPIVRQGVRRMIGLGTYTSILKFSVVVGD